MATKYEGRWCRFGTPQANKLGEFCDTCVRYKLPPSAKKKEVRRAIKYCFEPKILWDCFVGATHNCYDRIVNSDMETYIDYWCLNESGEKK